MVVENNGSVKTKYFELDLNLIQGAQYIRSRIDDKKYTGHFELFYRAYDENRLPYDSPQMDLIQNYYICINGKEIRLDQFLAANGAYDNYYAVISEHTHITSIEHFQIFPHNKFYSVPISKEVADFIIDSGFKFTVHEKLFDWDLLSLRIETGCELLLFLESSNPIIQRNLNRWRFIYIRRKICEITESKIKKGLTVVTSDGEVHSIFGDLKNALKLQENESKLPINHEMNVALAINERRWKAYENAYIKYFKELIGEEFRFDEFEKKIKDEFKNPLVYGYLNEYIETEMAKDGILL